MSTRIHPDEMSTRIHPNTVHQNSPNKNFHQNSPKHCPLELGKCVHQNSPQMSTRIHPLMSTRFLQPSTTYSKVLALHAKLFDFLLLLLFSTLKASKSRKQIMASWILPKNERWGNFQYRLLHQNRNKSRSKNLISGKFKR